MKRIFNSLLLACALTASATAFAQDQMKQDDTMKKGDGMKKDQMKSDKPATTAKAAKPTAGTAYTPA
jgi:pentapeptide MXKDX repeat protein